MGFHTSQVSDSLCYQTLISLWYSVPVVRTVCVAAHRGVGVVADDPDEAGVGAETDVVPARVAHVVAPRVQVSTNQNVLRVSQSKANVGLSIPSGPRLCHLYPRPHMTIVVMGPLPPLHSGLNRETVHDES